MCFFEDFKTYSRLSQFPLGGSVCTQWQVKHKRCSRNCRVQKNHNILRKKTIFNEHSVQKLNKEWRKLLVWRWPLATDQVQAVSLDPVRLCRPGACCWWSDPARPWNVWRVRLKGQCVLLLQPPYSSYSFSSPPYHVCIKSR